MIELKGISYLIMLATVAAVALLSTGSVFAHTGPTQYFGGGGYVSGQVLGFDYYNELIPIAWAKVVASNGVYTFRAASGGDGGYQLFLPVGYYNVTATEPGYVPHTMFVSVSDGSSSVINFYLEESRIPVPEFQPQMVPLVLVFALAATLAAKRATKRHERLAQR